MNVKELREKKGLTQQELSDKTGIPRPRIAKWEQGKGQPKATDVKILEGIFGELIPAGQNGVPKSTPVRLQEAQHAPDLKDEIIALLKEKSNSEGRKTLQYLQVNNALLKTVVQALARVQASLDKRKLKDVQIEMNNLVEQHLEALRKEGT